MQSADFEASLQANSSPLDFNDGALTDFSAFPASGVN